MLMVTTTEGMLDGVHSNTTNLRPAVTLNLVLVVGSASLEEGLVDTSTTGDDTDGSSASGVKNLLGTRWKLDSGLASVGVVGDDDTGVSGALGKDTSVTDLGLDAAACSTFGHVADGHDVSDVKLGLLSGVDELAGRSTFGSNEDLVVLTVFVRILELDLGKGSSSTRVVDDVLDDTLDVTVSLGVIERSVFGGALSGSLNGLEDASGTLTTGSDDTSHFG